MKLQTRYVCLWSPRQRCVHLETEEEMCGINMGAMLRGVQVDYVVLAIFRSEPDARAFLNVIQKIRNDQDRGRGTCN